MTTLLLGLFVVVFVVYLWLQLQASGEAVSRDVVTGEAIDSTLLQKSFFRTARLFAPTEATAVAIRWFSADKPMAPQGLEAQASRDGTRVIVRWDVKSVPADASVVIQRAVTTTPAVSNDTSSVELGVVPALSGEFVDTDPPQDVTVSYMALVKTAMAVSSPGAAVVVRVYDSVPPPPPSEVNITRDDQGVVLRWTNPTVPDFAYVVIMRATKPGEVGAVLADRLETTIYHDTTVAPGGEYWYTLLSVDKSANQTPFTPALPAGKANPFEAGGGATDIITKEAL